MLCKRTVRIKEYWKESMRYKMLILELILLDVQNASGIQSGIKASVL